MLTAFRRMFSDEAAATFPHGADTWAASPNPRSRTEPGRWPWKPVVAALLFLLSGIACFHASRLITPDLYAGVASRDIWFDADITRVASVETDRDGLHMRTTLHPLHSLIAYPPVFLLRRVLRFDDATAMRLFHASAAGVWVTLCFLLFCRLGWRPGEAALLAAVGATSATALFYFPVPETFSLAAISVMPTLFLLSGAESESGSEARWIGAHLSALSITITNVMAPLAGIAASFSWRKIGRITAMAAVWLLALSLLQRAIFPTATLPIGNAFVTEPPFFYMPEAGGPIAVLRAFFFHPMVAPAFSFLPNWRVPTYPIMSFQASRLFSSGAAGAVATAAWGALLLIGLSALAFGRARRTLRLATLASILGQLLLHLIYGRETFLYSLDFLPFLLVAVALSAGTRARRATVVLAAVLVAANLVNNVRQLRWAVAFANRQPVLLAWQERHPVNLHWTYLHLGLSSDNLAPPPEPTQPASR